LFTALSVKGGIKVTPQKRQGRSLSEALGSSKEDESNKEENDQDNETGAVVAVNRSEGTDEQLENKGENDKTPAELAAETPKETQERFGIVSDIPDDVHNDPSNSVSRDNRVPQVMGGTHLHPDVARSTYNDSLGLSSDQAAVNVERTAFVYANEAEEDDKGINGPQPEETPISDADGDVK
jgi:hypothetical protein